MGKYVYITENNLENRQKYQFAEFEGQAFLDAYYESRQAEGPGGEKEPGQAERPGDEKEPGQAEGTAAADRADGCCHVWSKCKMICEEHADRILKSFEVRKRIYSEYDEKGVPAVRKDETGRIDQSAYSDFDLYLDFAELMLYMYGGTDNLKYLNALLKVDDTLLSIAKQLTENQKKRLAAVLGRETAYVRELTGKNGRKAGKNTVLDTAVQDGEKPQECSAGRHRLREFAMVCADSARTKAYLQILCRAGMDVNRCYIMSEHPKAMEEELQEYIQLQECKESQRNAESQKCEELQENAELPGDGKYFNAGEPVLYTLHKYEIPFTFIPAGDINSPAALEALSAAPEKYMIYSGFGGQILKPELFQIGKQYIHAHAGMVPEFRGSTTVYYHMLETGNAAVSVMFLNEKLDEGDILARYTYEITDTDVNIDMVYEPYIRAAALRSVLGEYIECGGFQRTKQPKEGNTYYIIHPVLKHMAIINHL